MFVNSKKIKVFPSAWRGTGINPEATLNTEENLTGIINRLSRAKGYASHVVSWDSGSGKLVFSINGYLFELAEANTLGYPLYAGIKLLNDDGGIADFSNKTLSNLVENNVSVLDRVETEGEDAKFCGVLFTNSESDLNGFDSNCTLQLFDAQGYVPEESYLIVDTSQIKNNAVMGGDPKPIRRLFTTDMLETPVISAYSNAFINFYGSSFIMHGDVFPSSSNTWDLGKSGNEFRSIYGKDIYAASTINLYGFDNSKILTVKQSGTLDRRHTDVSFTGNAGSVMLKTNDMVASINGLMNIYASSSISLSTAKEFGIWASKGLYARAVDGPICLEYGWSGSSEQGIVIGNPSSPYRTLLYAASGSFYPAVRFPSQSGDLALQFGAYIEDPSAFQPSVVVTNNNIVYGAAKICSVYAYNTEPNPYLPPQWVISSAVVTTGSTGNPVYLYEGEFYQCNISNVGAGSIHVTSTTNDFVLVNSPNYSAATTTVTKNDIYEHYNRYRLGNTVIMDFYIDAPTGFGISTVGWVRFDVDGLLPSGLDFDQKNMPIVTANFVHDYADYSYYIPLIKTVKQNNKWYVFVSVPSGIKGLTLHVMMDGISTHY